MEISSGDCTGTVAGTVRGLCGDCAGTVGGQRRGGTDGCGLATQEGAPPLLLPRPTTHEPTRTHPHCFAPRRTSPSLSPTFSATHKLISAPPSSSPSPISLSCAAAIYKTETRNKKRNQGTRRPIFVCACGVLLEYFLCMLHTTGPDTWRSGSGRG